MHGIRLARIGLAALLSLGAEPHIAHRIEILRRTFAPRGRAVSLPPKLARSF
jgi:hypothetical protein